MIVYLVVRRFNPQQEEIIRSLSNTNTKPRYIIGILRDQAPNQPIVYRDIYNKKADLRRKEIGQKSVLEYLQELLEQEGYKYWFKQD